MRRTARIKATRVHPRPLSAKVVVIDEAHLFLGSSQYQELRPNTASMATQAVMYFNSGKRVRFLFQHRRADGSPLRPWPEKFLPMQTLRRQGASLREE